MKAERNMVRLAVVQHLRDYGIKVKHWNRIHSNSRPQGRDKKITYSGVFGTPLHALPRCTLLEHASIPQFLVDACSYLEKHIHTEGLFRKSGSVTRLKILKAKVNQGEKWLTLSPPCDVAGLVKQFFRELPEPVLPLELHEAFFRAQQLQNDEKISATILLSCLLPEKTIDTLHYFLKFLNNVSLRSKDNKMDVNNLAVVFAPNLFHSGDGSEKVTSLAEKQLHFQAATVHTLIENFEGIGCVPEFILEKIPAMLGECAASKTPSLENLEAGDGSRVEESKRRRRRSVGDIVSGALSKLKSNRTPAPSHTDASETSSGTPVIKTPTWKRKLLVDSSQSLGFSNKKRRSLRHNIALELLPSGFLSQNCTPSSIGTKRIDGSPQVSLESLQGPLLLSTGSATVKSSASINRRKSKRLENKRMERLESGKSSCFSPKLNRKEIVRKSLRLRFSLGKSKDTNTFSFGVPAPNGSENIGWRLANQGEGRSHNWFSVDPPFTSDEKDNDAKGWKHRSKSEENLITPVCKNDAHRKSWNCASPTESQVTCDHLEVGTTLESYLNSGSCQSEPALIVAKPPTVPGELHNRNVAQNNSIRKSSGSLNENGQTGETVLKIKKAFSESGCNLCSLFVGHKCSTGNDLCGSNLLSQQVPSTSTLKADQPLEGQSHWSSTELPSQPVTNTLLTNGKINPCPTDVSRTSKMSNNLNCISSSDQQEKNGIEVPQSKNTSSPLVKDPTNTDKKCATVFSLPGLVSEQVTSNYKQKKEQDENCNPGELPAPSSGTDSGHPPFELHQSVFLANELGITLNKGDSSASTDGTQALEFSSKLPTLDIPLRNNSVEELPDTEHGHHFKVVEHIQRFNSLSLNDQTPKYKTMRSPLKFKRTPVRQSVRRMNALSSSNEKLVANRSRMCKISFGSPKIKPLSHESGLSFNQNSLALKQNFNIKQNKLRDNACQKDLSTEGFWKTELAMHTKHTAAFKEKNLGSKLKNSDQNVNQSVSEDWTNKKVSRVYQADCVLPKHNIVTKTSAATPEKSISNVILHKVSEKEKNQYKGSPKCPISTKLTTKAIDL
ncbi:rho GTPase-activating protein 11A-like [Hypanus sabinus]|uniref:rho GTPase-activating protein 11A-like n=1 Tax=Hypanus sabinus TaxID=79690 RepID=UPI0028C46861|nr:rho GTPase-activating protein 11A-like [Hypanus sabinus]